ncbi:uncharacterized protein FOBCDRAFT_148665 [Fusarium oxysporum Fo47]|uniref:Uncharacterized protein n=1 Tax=Fusarium oxysporum Fo47 TaxID=660027 RepID=W9JM45_FUSOX|nr:uncharacterized protein FOBCDRAFT_148665 [Fusarium oxysporum Fo47]EWZ30453.1 hypothetical protein FOZG_15936 [Fusarium oxysporum Fo47]QKD62100.2 hypothetical protein FOBCDRAFT_148665 [Fusarium oxysporum Fo47]
MSIAFAEKPDSEANVEILRVARQIQHLAHFLSQGPAFSGVVLTEDDLRTARDLNPVTRITSHRRLSELEFPREWVEDDGALAIALHDWREQVEGMKQSNSHATEEEPDQVADIPTEADIKVDSDVSFLSYSMKREAHWVEKTKELEKKLRQSEQEKQSAIQYNLKLQLEVEALQRKAQSLYQALFDPDNRIHEANVMAKVKLHGEIRQLEKLLDAANSKNESLVKKNKDLESCNKGLITENEELVKIQELESSNKDLVTENGALVEENRDIDSDNGYLIATSKDLLTKIALARDAAKSYKDLMNRNAALADTNKRLEESLKKIVTDAKCSLRSVS